MAGKWHYFSETEVEGLKEELVARIDQAAELVAKDCARLGIPRIVFVITSGLRTPTDNIIAGGASKSSHVRGLAVDLRARESRALGLIVKAAYAVGFTRIGIYFRKEGAKIVPTHVHVDCDDSLDPDVMWLDDEGKA